jgi:hypothetical protein
VTGHVANVKIYGCRHGCVPPSSCQECVPKIQRVISAARAWRKLQPGVGDRRNWSPESIELYDAIDALGKPEPRYHADMGSVVDREHPDSPLTAVEVAELLNKYTQERECQP